MVLNDSKLSFTKKKTRRQQHSQQEHLCLDIAYSSKTIRQQIIKRGYVPHIPYKRKRCRQKKEETAIQKRNSLSKNKRWVVKRTNS